LVRKLEIGLAHGTSDCWLVNSAQCRETTQAHMIQFGGSQVAKKGGFWKNKEHKNWAEWTLILSSHVRDDTDAHDIMLTQMINIVQGSNEHTTCRWPTSTVAELEKNILLPALWYDLNWGKIFPIILNSLHVTHEAFILPNTPVHCCWGHRHVAEAANEKDSANDTQWRLKL